MGACSRPSVPWGAVQVGSGCVAAEGPLGALTSLTSFTALTFSGASLNNSSKTSSAERFNKHLITVLLSLGQIGTFFPTEVSQSNQSRESCSFNSCFLNKNSGLGLSHCPPGCVAGRERPPLSGTHLSSMADDTY